MTGLGLGSLPHQQWYVSGSSFIGELQPGQRHLTSAPSGSAPCGWALTLTEE